MPAPLQTPARIVSVQHPRSHFGPLRTVIGVGVLMLLSACATEPSPAGDGRHTLIEEQTACVAGDIPACNAANHWQAP